MVIRKETVDNVYCTVAVVGDSAAGTRGGAAEVVSKDTVDHIHQRATFVCNGAARSHSRRSAVFNTQPRKSHVARGRYSKDSKVSADAVASHGDLVDAGADDANVCTQIGK